MNVSSISDVMYTVPSGKLTDNQTYHWRVNASKGDLTSAWSEGWSFKISSSQPAPPPPGGKAKIQVIVTLDGAQWTGGIQYRINGPGNLSGSSVPHNFNDIPAGEYSIYYQSGGPGGATLASITPSPTQDVGSGSTISFTLNFRSQSTSTITINATLNGLPWSGNVNYSISGPFQDADTSVPKTLSGLPSGDYTLIYQYGGPDGATMKNISPSPMQKLPSGGSIVYTLNYVTPPATGNIIVNATLDGAPWSGPVEYSISGPITDLEHSVPQTFANVPAGYDYTLTYNSGGPPNAHLIAVRPGPTQKLPGGQIVFNLDFRSQQVSGSIIVNATLDGKPWQTAVGSGSINYTIVGPKVDSASSIPQTFGNQPGGKYTLQYNSGGPIGATLTSITPSPAQELTANRPNLVFTLNFHAQAKGTVSVQAMLNDQPWSGPVGYVVTGPYVESGSAVPHSLGNAPAGNYSVTYSSGGPPGAVFEGVEPPAQSLQPGGHIAFILRFKFQGGVLTPPVLPPLK